MLDVTRLYCSQPPPAEAVRGAAPPGSPGAPVVVWNSTRDCNLSCPNCFSDASPSNRAGELTTEEARAMIKDLAGYHVPALVFSGGEPLLRPDLAELIGLAGGLSIRPVLFTNGTLVNLEMAERLKRAGCNYVGISIEGLGDSHDRLRGREGAFDAALQGLRNCARAGLQVGLRLTLAQRTLAELDAVFDFVEREGIPQVCFSHLVYAGRGNHMRPDDLTHAESREVMDLILHRTLDFCNRRVRVRVLTDENDVDGVYIYLKLSRIDPQKSANALQFLRKSGGARLGSGVGLGSIDSEGNVHAHPFWTNHSFGNVKRRSFSKIWRDRSDPLLAGLRDRLPLLKGRCALCAWKELCGGSSRVRAEDVYGDPWMHDPACYLTQEEILRNIPKTAGRKEEELLLEGQAA
jgi:radical SAM protein with 4Fe4S-binding SPASM domain